MPTFSPVGRVVREGLEPDYEGEPIGHYRGRGRDQSRTGPGGPWLEPGAARYLRKPSSGEGSFRGRGPKGYVRSDERIREDVCDYLTYHADLDASEIEVSVEQGLVTLSGVVPTRYAKFLAEDLAASVPSVADVVNLLRIRRSGEPGRVGGPSDDSRGLPMHGSRHR